MLHYSQLADALRPTSEIDDPDLFAGRKEQVVRGLQAIHSPGAIPAIIGDRGLGKSSLVQQLGLIAQGDKKLLQRLDKLDLSVEPRDAFRVLVIRCSDSTPTLSEVLARIANALSEAVSQTKTFLGIHDSQETSRKLRFNLGMVTSETAFKATSESRGSHFDGNDLEEFIFSAARELNSLTKRRILVIIDELDRLVDSSGLAAFLKTSPSNYLRFALVGIADNATQLIGQHASISRRLVPVVVPEMNESDLSDILALACSRLQQHGVALRFTETATKLLIEVSEGFPWYIHVLGQDAIAQAFRNDSLSLTISSEHVESAISRLRQQGLSAEYNDVYQRVVGRSEQREILLRLLAEWDGRDIPTTDIYEMARRLGVTNPSASLFQILRMNEPAVLVRPNRVDGLVRFSNRMFKIYVKHSQSIYADWDKKVNAVYRYRRKNFASDTCS